MMHRPVLYLETSIFGFYYDDAPRNQVRNEAVRALLQQMAAGKFRAVTSPDTIAELSAAAEPLRERLLELLADVEQPAMDEDEIGRLVSCYTEEKIAPAEFVVDLRHAAAATVGGADVLVSLNLKHLANEWTERKINAVNLREGYRLISIRTPEEVLEYDD